MQNSVHRNYDSDRGFSVLELLVVVGIIAILSSISIFYLLGHQELYKPDDESLLLTDVLQEARQRSLTQRETLRVEINLTKNLVTLYDENSITTAVDDVVLRTLTLFDPSVVRLGARAANVGSNPPETLPVPTSQFVTSSYTPSFGDSVCTLRFMANGQVMNAGNNSVGSGAITTGATIHLWSPQQDDPGNAAIARAITVIGSSGTVRLWEWDHDSTETNKWKDSRRAGSFGS